MKSSKQNNFFLVAGLIFLAALSRLLPHPPNFTPIGGMALFGAAYFGKKVWALVVPFLAIWFSSLLLDNLVYARMFPDYYEGFVWFSNPYVYLAFGVIVLLGFFLLKKVTLPRLLTSVFGATTIFFLVSNFGVWASGTMYPKTVSGLLSCYAAGIPFLSNPTSEHFFFLNTLAGDLFYTGALFGVFALVQNRFRAPRLAS